MPGEIISSLADNGSLEGICGVSVVWGLGFVFPYSDFYENEKPKGGVFSRRCFNIYSSS